MGRIGEILRGHKEPKPEPEYVEFHDDAYSLMEQSLSTLARIPEFQEAFTLAILGQPQPKSKSKTEAKQRVLFGHNSQSSRDFTVIFSTGDETFTVEYRKKRDGVAIGETLIISGLYKDSKEYFNGDWKIEFESDWFSSRPNRHVFHESVRVKEKESDELYYHLRNHASRSEKFFYAPYSPNTREEVLPKAKEFLEKLPTSKVSTDS